MKVITAPQPYDITENDITCFLGGGITNCYEWQDEVIEILKEKENLDDLVIFNPRRKDFDIKDPNASLQQITWEHEYLTKCKIFSMYFVSGPSDQPICMYELGKYGHSGKFSIISVEDGYKRKNDVYIQCDLDNLTYNKQATPSIHAKAIINTYEIIKYTNEVLNKMKKVK